MSTPYVAYSYADGSANTLRPTRITYPNGREVDYDYGVADSPDDLFSRVFQIQEDTDVLAQYDYLGATNIVRCDYTEPQVRWDLSPTGDTFTGLDSLDRVVDNLWRNYGVSTDADRIKYTYDRAGNRTSRENTVATSGNDELYGYDGVNRLRNLGRGDLTVAKDRVTAPTFAERWNLDATGNWSGYGRSDYLEPDDSVEQTRTANPVNEITGIANSLGTAWAQPAYDRAGNMTAVPQPLDQTDTFEATYDAWNRLVLLEDGETAVAEYDYDPLNRRVTVDDGTAVRHAYFSQQWQALEERLNGSTDAARQFVWGLRYIDDLILRDRTTVGPLDERLYALQDANWNVDAIVDEDGVVQERYRYAAYGTPTFLQSDFTPRTPNQSDFQCETLYCGYRFDDQTGLYQVRFRYLNSNVGIWLTRDPLGYLAGHHLYCYVQGMVITQRDPYGLLYKPDPVPAPVTTSVATAVAQAIPVLIGPAIFIYVITDATPTGSKADKIPPWPIPPSNSDKSGCDLPPYDQYPKCNIRFDDWEFNEQEYDVFDHILELVFRLHPAAVEYGRRDPGKDCPFDRERGFHYNIYCRGHVGDKKYWEASLLCCPCCRLHPEGRNPEIIIGCHGRLRDE